MNFSEEFLRELCAGKIVGDFPPFDTGKNEEVEKYVKHLLGEIGARKDLLVDADFNSYGSGYASYVAVKISKKDKSDTRVTVNGENKTEWTDGLLIYVSKLSPFWFWGGSDWTVNYEGERRTGGSSGFLEPESADDLNRELWERQLDRVVKVFENYGYRLLTEKELSVRLWFEVKIPTILANDSFRVFDCFFYWED